MRHTFKMFLHSTRREHAHVSFSLWHAVLIYICCPASFHFENTPGHSNMLIAFVIIKQLHEPMIWEWVSFTNPRSFSPYNPLSTCSCSPSTHYGTCRYFCRDFQNNDQPLKIKKKKRKVKSSQNGNEMKWIFLVYIYFFFWMWTPC